MAVNYCGKKFYNIGPWLLKESDDLDIVMLQLLLMLIEQRREMILLNFSSFNSLTLLCKLDPFTVVNIYL